MNKNSKFWAAGIGLLFGGPIGALFGFGLGSLVDQLNDPKNTGSPFNTKQNPVTDASVSLLVLAAAVIRADRKVMVREIEFVRQFFIQQYGVSFTEQRMQMLDRLVRQTIPLQQVCVQIRQNTNYSTRLQLIHFLFGIAQADGAIVKEEMDVIQSAASYLGIYPQDFASIQAMFIKDTNQYYTILEIDKNASEEDIKKAYRRMAMKYHPDKIAGQGEEFEKAAREKFQKVNEAYQAIKAEKGFA